MALWRRLAALLSSAFLLSPLPATAREGEAWPVKGTLVGKSDKKSRNISGIACSTPAGFPRECIVIDDNSQSAQALTLHDGWLEAGPSIPLISTMLGDHRLELDGEGVAYADGVFYVIGSHGHPRDTDHHLDPVANRDRIAARIAAASQIVRIAKGADGRLTRLGGAWTLTDLIAAEPALQPFAGQRLDKNGVTVEGIAVVGGRLFAGFRGPALPDGRAPVLSASLAGLSGRTARSAQLFKLRLGTGQGARDLAPFGDRILVLAGPVGDAPGPYVVHLWDGATEDGSRPLRDITALAGTTSNRKPEAILPLDCDADRLRALILFDGEPEGAPMAVDLPLR